MKPGNPLLAATADLDTLEYPVWAFPKVDGVRGMPKGGVMFSRTLTPFPNRAIQEMTADPLAANLDGLDGEIVLGDDPKAPGRLCNRTSGALQRASHPGPFTIWLFDMQSEDTPFFERYFRLVEAEERGLLPSWAHVIKGALCETREDVEMLEELWVGQGYEGVVLRKHNGRYKFGRSTVQQGLLMRLCRSARKEAKIIGFVQAEANDNEKTLSATGHAKRSSKKEGKRLKPTLGALKVLDLDNGETFTVGTGFDDRLRKEIWEAIGTAECWMGSLITYSFKPHGSERKPRHPVFQCRRLEIDL